MILYDGMVSHYLAPEYLTPVAKEVPMTTPLIPRNPGTTGALIHACSLEELRKKGCVVVTGGRHGVAVFYNDGAPRRYV